MLRLHPVMPTTCTARRPITSGYSPSSRALIRRFHEWPGCPRLGCCEGCGATRHAAAGNSSMSTTPLPTPCPIHLMKNLLPADDWSHRHRGRYHHRRVRRPAVGPQAPTVGYTGPRSSSIPSRPDGTPRKLLDVQPPCQGLAWRAVTSLEDGNQARLSGVSASRNSGGSDALVGLSHLVCESTGDEAKSILSLRGEMDASLRGAQ